VKSFLAFPFCLLANVVLSQAKFSEVSSGNAIFSIQAGHGVSVGDYDNDGDDDLLISASPVKLFRNNGNFSFSDATLSSGLNVNGQVSVWMDADNDGWLDVYIAHRNSTLLFKNNKNGTFTGLSPTSTGLINVFSAQGLLVGDLNGDRWLDIYSNNFRYQNQLFINKGGFLFEDRIANSEAAINNAGMGGVLTDFDKDNDLDIYLVFDGSTFPNALLQNDGTGKFVDAASQLGLNAKAEGMGVDVADFNHDGRNDFYVTNLYDNACFVSQPSGVYIDKAVSYGMNDKGMGWGVVCFDYDNDTFADVYINNEYGYSSYSSKLYKNEAGTGFSIVSRGTSLENNSRGYGCSSSDLNNDGKQDLVLVNYINGGVKVFKNDETSIGNWVSFNLVGTSVNKFGVGSRVEIVSNGVSQFDEVSSGSGYSGQNTMQIHFGLGAASEVAEVKIYWTDGSLDSYQNVQANSRYLVVQNEDLSIFSATQFQDALQRPNQLSPPPDLDPGGSEDFGNHSIARIWNESMLTTIRKDFGRPTVQARNLYHVSIGMYDAWAAFDEVAKPYLLGNTVGGFPFPFDGITPNVDRVEARDQAISFAAFRLILQRYGSSPGASITIPNVRQLFATLGYDESFTSTDYSTGSPAALGNYIAAKIIEFGLMDGSNEALGFVNQYYSPLNAPMEPALPGAQTLIDPNRWQPLTLSKFIDQNGNEIGNTPPFLTPEWGNVVPFALKPWDREDLTRDGGNYKVYHNPGAPPQLDKVNGGGLSSEYKWNFELVSAWSSHLDPADSVKVDISPATIGNIQSYPTTLGEYRTFYDFENGGDKVTGHAINPKTNLPYQPQLVYRGDYTRVLAEFWADGPNSETPPGHWFTILNYVNDHPSFERKFAGQGQKMNALEWDVKSYFTLGGALHDVAITAWGIKGYYDNVRPITAIRYLAGLGQSSDMTKPNFHPAGIELKPGFIEQVGVGDPLVGPNNEHFNKIKLYCWRGPSYITTPATDQAGVGWILAENWFPYQRPTFVTPPFAGYISGHSTYSSAAAEVLTLLTGDEFFPGGMGEFHAPKNEYLVFEEGPSQDITLQWARYKDASDQCSLSRIWGGIHPPADDIPGRHIGKIIGKDAFQLAVEYFNGTYTGLEETIAHDVEVFPNPVAHDGHVRIKSNKNLEGTTLVLLDLMGRESKKILVRESVFETEMDLSGEKAGLYLIRVQGVGGRVSRRVVVR
jgi:ASPIC and UnbV/FG-GAP-like repeat/FG-GAP repeat